MADTDSGPDRCKRCGRMFACGIAAGGKTCWCFDLPPLPKPPGVDAGNDENQSSKKGCYCPDCLKELTRSDTQSA